MGIARIASRPAVRKAAEVLVDIAAERIRKGRAAGGVAPSTGERNTMVEQAATAIAERPALVNAMNAEPWYQSRVKVGLLIAALGWVLNRFNIDLGLTEEDKELATSLIMGFGGGLASVGRWISGLKPMTFNPLSWFGFK